MSLMRLGNSARALRVKYVSKSLCASVALLWTCTKSMNCDSKAAGEGGVS